MDFKNDFSINIKVTKTMVIDGALIKGLLPDEVEGDFDCSGVQLTTLEGCPTKVKNSFNCSNNNLSNLKGCPNTVGKHFLCSYNFLNSLTNSPEYIFGSFDCSSNLLTTLKGGPKEVLLNFNCNNNHQLINLEYFPSMINGNISCFDLIIEEKFINDLKQLESNHGLEYFQNLLNFMIKKNFNFNDIKSWPDYFIETLDDAYKNLFKSYKSINKYSL